MSGEDAAFHGTMESDSQILGDLITRITDVHHRTQACAVKAVNISLTVRNWLIGFYIVEFELSGSNRAAYGERLMEVLSHHLANRGLRRVTPRELRRYRQFYQCYPNMWGSLTPTTLSESGVGGLAPVLQTARRHIRESATPESQTSETTSTGVPAPHPELFVRLSFTHLAEIIQLPDESQRRLYEFECIRGNWSVRELRRQITSLYYERLGLSKEQSKLSARTGVDDVQVNVDRIVRDPYVFEFLGLRSQDTMGESDLEDALLDRLQEFLFEMGHGFCFEARQKRILIGDEYFFVDLVLYHRILKCHVLIELKVDAFRHEHLGQLNSYVAYFKKHEMTEGDQPPIGILLCTQKNDALVEFALGDISNKLFVSRYALEIPDKAAIESFLRGIAKEFGYE